MLSFRHAVLALLLVACSGLARIAVAQNLYSVDTRPPRGFMPTSDQLASPFDAIDTFNGKLHLQIPLGSLPSGRAGLGFDLDLVYDSHLHDIVTAVDGPFSTYTDLRYIQEL